MIKGQFAKGHIPWDKGKNRTKQIKEKISKSLKGKCYNSFNKEHRKKLSESAKNRKYTKTEKERLRNLSKNRKLSEETKRKMSQSSKRHIVTDITRKKISDAQKLEKHWNWQNGKSFEDYSFQFNKELKEKIKERDNYICQICNKNQNELRTKTGRTYKLHIHHIDYNKKNNNPNNLISLCNNCHIKTNYNRKYWINYFNKILLCLKKK